MRTRCTGVGAVKAPECPSESLVAKAAAAAAAPMRSVGTGIGRSGGCMAGSFAQRLCRCTTKWRSCSGGSGECRGRRRRSSPKWSSAVPCQRCRTYRGWPSYSSQSGHGTSVSRRSPAQAGCAPPDGIPRGCRSWSGCVPGTSRKSQCGTRRSTRGSCRHTERTTGRQQRGGRRGEKA